MPKSQIPAAGEAMPAEGQTPTRRRLFALAGKASAVVAATSALARPAFAMSASAFMAGAVADPVFAAIEDHRRAFAFANERGVPDDETDRRTDLEDAKLWALAETEPQTLEGARRLLDYVADYDDGCLPDADLHCAAMRSVAAALAKMGAANV